MAQIVVGDEVLGAGRKGGDSVLHRMLVADDHHGQVRAQLVDQFDDFSRRGVPDVFVAQHQIRRIALQYVLQVFQVGDPGHPQGMAGVAQMTLDALGHFLGGGDDQQDPGGFAQQGGWQLCHRLARYHGNSVFAGAPGNSRARRGTR